MEHQSRIVTVMLLLLCLCSSLCTSQEIPMGPYLGQEPPGIEPEIFAPDIISLVGRFETYPSFSLDGNELFFTVTNASWTRGEIWHTWAVDGNWIEPTPAFFMNQRIHWEPFITWDGLCMFFTSNRNPSSNMDIWMIERMADGWSSPLRLDSPVNSGANDGHTSMTQDGTLYFHSRRDGGNRIYRSSLVDGQYTQVENVSTQLATRAGEGEPFIAPDESYLIFISQTRSGGYGGWDLWICFRNEDDTWTEPQNLGPAVNTRDDEYGPRVTHDGRYLLFTREKRARNMDIYWVDIRAVLPDPNGPIQNLTTGQRFDSIQCAITYANDGDEIVLAPETYQEIIDLSGKDVVLRSTEPNNPRITETTIIKGDKEHPVVTFSDNSGVCRLRGLTITGGQVGLVLQKASPRFEYCRIINNVGHGIDMLARSDPTISHTLICTNGGAGIHMTAYEDIDVIYNEPILTNCTIAQNTEGGIHGGMVTIRNCIVYGNGTVQLSPVSATVNYSCIAGGFNGPGNIDTDPLFAELAYLDSNGTPDDPNDDVWATGDYHLKSQAGCFDPNSADWVLDDVTSPCIDAGDPNTPVDQEPSPHGDRVNMGVYGGTKEASKSYLDGQ